VVERPNRSTSHVNHLTGLGATEVHVGGGHGEAVERVLRLRGGAPKRGSKKKGEPSGGGKTQASVLSHHDWVRISMPRVSSRGMSCVSQVRTTLSSFFKQKDGQNPAAGVPGPGPAPLAGGQPAVPAQVTKTKLEISFLICISG
jgi:hypothetical protein